MGIGGEDGIIDAYATCGGAIFTFIEVARAFLPHLRTGKGFDPIVAVAEPAFGNVVNSFDLSSLEQLQGCWRSGLCRLHFYFLSLRSTLIPYVFIPSSSCACLPPPPSRPPPPATGVLRGKLLPAPAA